MFDSPRWLNVVMPCFLVLVGLIKAMPHLADEVWQDEAWTLLNFAQHGFFYPFTNYHLPNNHILVSAVLSFWWQPGDPVVYLRLLPLISYLLSLPLLYFAARNLAGPVAGVMGLALFVGSGVTEGFALQLRGYSFAWLPMSLLLLMVPLYLRLGNVITGLFCVVAMASSIAILPTNLVPVLAFLGWAVVIVLVARMHGESAQWKRLLLLAAGPVLGLACYVLVWEKLVYFSQQTLSQWTAQELLVHWFWSTQSAYLALIPVMLVGLVVLGRQTNKGLQSEQIQARINLSLGATFLAAVLVWLLMAMTVPFPRTLVPMLPVWYLLSGLLFAAGWQVLFSAKPRLGQALLLPVVLATIAFAATSRPCGGDPPASEYPADLCHRYFHNAYHPTRTASLLKEMVKGSGLPVVTDFEGRYALGFVAANDKQAPVRPILYHNWQEHVRTAEVLYAPIIVTHNLESLERIRSAIGLSHITYVERATTGFFKIYEPKAS